MLTVSVSDKGQGGQTHGITSREPIDLATGAYLYEHDDLTVGTASFPFGLTLHRSYTSNNRYTSGPLGVGWSHGFAISATPNMDVVAGTRQTLIPDLQGSILASLNPSTVTLPQDPTTMALSRCVLRKSSASALLLGAPGSGPATEATLECGAPRDTPGELAVDG